MGTAVRVGSSWTIWAPAESMLQFIARIPANEAAPDGDCDYEDEWTSGSVTIHVCARCGDKTPEQCLADFNSLVAELKKPENFPPDP